MIKDLCFLNELKYFYNSLNALQSPYKIPRALLENVYPKILNFVPISKIQQIMNASIE